MKTKCLFFIAVFACVVLFSANKRPQELTPKLKTANKLKNEAKSEADLHEAFRLYSELAEEGNSVAILYQGGMYQKGKGVEKDEKRAIDCFMKASELGNAHATAEMGTCYLKGKGVEQNFEIARQWYMQSAASGKSCIGQYYLGSMYYKGLGGEQNYEKAVELFSAATRANHIASFYMLGHCYLNGYGVEKDEKIATSYFRKISRWGVASGKRELEALEFKKATSFSPFVDSDIPEFFISPSCKELVHKAVSQSLVGNYEGVLVTYDWSGNTVEYLNKLELLLSIQNDTIVGTWIENDTLQTKIFGKIYNNALHFIDSEYKRHDRSIPFFSENYIFKSAYLDFRNSDTEEYLIGNIKFWLKIGNEPAKPHSIVLRKKSKTDIKANIGVQNLNFYPVPVSNILHVSFTSLYSEMAKVEIRNQNGDLVYSSVVEIKSGQNGFSIPATWQKGIYLLSISNNRLLLSKKFVKN